MAITPLPTPPSRDDAANFSARADAFLGALPLFATQVGAAADTAAAAAVTAVNAPGTSATSATSLAIGTGSKSLTIQTGKAFAVGQYVMVAAAAAPANWMNGQITAHNPSTGALTISVDTSLGAGTLASWVISLSTPIDLALFAALVTAMIAGNSLSPGRLELGISGTGNRSAYLDLQTDDTYTDYGARLVRGNTGPGPNTDTLLTHRGTGALTLNTEDAGSILAFKTSNTLRWVITDTSLRPGADNAYAIGSASFRPSTIYAATGAISTSDGTLKTVRGPLTAVELAAAKTIAGQINVFQFNDAVAEKGPDGARLHFGVIAQDVIAAMTAQGLDPMRYAFVCHDAWEAEPGRAAIPEQRDADDKLIVPAQPAVPPLAAGDRYGIRYDELAMFLAAAQEQRLTALEAKLAA